MRERQAEYEDEVTQCTTAWYYEVLPYPYFHAPSFSRGVRSWEGRRITGAPWKAVSAGPMWSSNYRCGIRGKCQDRNRGKGVAYKGTAFLYALTSVYLSPEREALVWNSSRMLLMSGLYSSVVRTESALTVSRGGNKYRIVSDDLQRLALFTIHSST